MVNETIELLGLHGKDRVTGFEGVISTVSFDLYGCCQIVLVPKAKKNEGKLENGLWFDVNRVEITSAKRVMDVPQFAARERKPANYDRGPAEKPARNF